MGVYRIAGRVRVDVGIPAPCPFLPLAMIYSCRWGGCPSVFPSHPKLIVHLQEEHFTDEALDRDVGFKKGGFTEWLKVTGREGGTQSTSGMCWRVGIYAVNNT